MITPKIDHILKRYPKQRSELPLAYQKIYNEYYRKNREGETRMTSLSLKLERWLHTMVAADVKHSHEDCPTLEIGAGTLNHLPYEPHITDYDIVEPFEYLYQQSSHLKRIRNIYRDISEIDSRRKYSRILSIATLEHITNLPEVVARASCLLDKNGMLRISIPNEGTLMWKLGTQITGAEFRRMYGLDYYVLMRHEHVNSAAEIESILYYFFDVIRSRCFGISKYFAFYRFFECKKPILERAEAYLEKHS